jgi:formate C-acetyltransferase
MWHGGTKYHNFGSHGAGIANAADALEAIRRFVYEEKSVTKEELLAALANDFKGSEHLQGKLLSAAKMGNNEDSVDEIACRLMGIFSARLNNRDNGQGGVWRAGTGSAMEYLWKGEKCPATADGRNAGESYGSSFSPSLTAKLTGLLSTLQSFTKYDMTEIINGGPLTVEVHDTVLRNDEGISKVAQLVKAFVMLGGHQLQLNAVNREKMLEAQKHPEDYGDLIVRVWGWSGHFIELDKTYQDQIISRTEFMM